MSIHEGGNRAPGGERPRIGITMGDPAGVGPEIIAKALSDEEIYTLARPVVIGDSAVMRQAVDNTGTSVDVRPVKDLSECTYVSGTIEVFERERVTMDKLVLGEVHAMCGLAAYDYIERATRMAQEGSLDAVATAPINKASLQAAKVEEIGHTEILGALTGTHDPLTMFEIGRLRIFFLSRHVSLIRAIELVKKERIVDYLKRCTAALERIGVNSPRIAVAGLNPHSGEHGRFGQEEVREVTPAVEQAQSEGLRAVGPIGADSVFHQGLEGRFEAVLSLYHDQGHIAAKTYDFYRTVSVTLGMPILRTSVDHGTAFDLAGTGKADPSGMSEAIRVAARYAPFFLQYR